MMGMLCAGMALATLFVTLPYVAREVIPVLEAQVRPLTTRTCCLQC